MRHLPDLTPDEVALLPTGVIGATNIRLLVATTSGLHRFAMARFSARRVAVALTLIAVNAEKEHLAATAANDKA